MKKKPLPHDAYNSLAERYSQIVETKPHNAYYDRPAVKSLIPEVWQKRILDAGCGPGVYSEWLLGKGAEVTGIDANKKMLEYAARRLKGKTKLIQANLEEPLDFLEDEIFDGIISPLTITYIKDHEILFKEFNRVLVKNGWLVFSTEHPFFSYKYFN